MRVKPRLRLRSAVTGWVRKLALLVVTCALVACLAEIGLRIAGLLYLDRYDDQLQEDSRPGSETVNVVALGESSTVGLWLEPENSYPGQLRTMLQSAYPSHTVNVVVPPHIGQNTSQVANRIDEYLSRYQPRLVVVMAGTNNEWSLAESHVARFLPAGNWTGIKLRTSVALSRLRLYRVLRYGFLRATAGLDDKITRSLHRARYVWGGAEWNRWPPEPWIYDFAVANRPAFVNLWRHDLDIILTATTAAGARAVLMTYHLQPTYLPPPEVEKMAATHDAILIRNDIDFRRAIEAEGPDALLLHDGWHPNQRGYRLIAENVFDVILEGDLLGLGATVEPQPQRPHGTGSAVPRS